MILRIVRTLTLLVLAAFCGFGYLASFEQPEAMEVRVAYAGLGAACIVGALGDYWARRSGGEKVVAPG